MSRVCVRWSARFDKLSELNDEFDKLLRVEG